MRRQRDIEFNTLEVLVATAESGTLSGAAKQLGVSQSAVSQTLKQLEDATQTPLLVRRSKPVRLTPAGEILLDYAHHVLSATTTVLNQLSQQRQGVLSRLNLGMIDSFADTFGVQLISQVRASVDRVSIRTGLNTSLTQAFYARQLDVLITADPMDSQFQLNKTPLLRDPFVLVAPSTYDALSVSELAAELPFIHYSPESLIGGQTDVIAHRLKLSPQIQYELDSTTSLLQFVEAGFGWAILSALCLAGYSASRNGLVVKPLDDGKHARTIHAVSRLNEFTELLTPIHMATQKRRQAILQGELGQQAPWLSEQMRPL